MEVSSWNSVAYILYMAHKYVRNCGGNSIRNPFLHFASCSIQTPFMETNLAFQQHINVHEQKTIGRWYRNTDRI